MLLPDVTLAYVYSQEDQASGTASWQASRFAKRWLTRDKTLIVEQTVEGTIATRHLRVDTQHAEAKHRQQQQAHWVPGSAHGEELVGAHSDDVMGGLHCGACTQELRCSLYTQATAGNAVRRTLSQICQISVLDVDRALLDGPWSV